MKDYRLSHLEERTVRQYEEHVYRHGSYDDMLWQAEKSILKKELCILREKKEHIAYLDFACGTGRLLAFLEEEVEESFGVDVSGAMLSRAQEKVKKSELICSDITKEDALAGHVFDLITAFRFFLNADPVLREEVMRMLSRKLQDRHAILIFNMHGNMLSHRLFTKLWFWKKGRHLNVSTPEGAKRLAERNGLEVVRWYGFGVIPKIFYRWFGAQHVYVLDCIFSHVPLMKYISFNLVFVCRKK